MAVRLRCRTRPAPRTHPACPSRRVLGPFRGLSSDPRPVAPHPRCFERGPWLGERSSTPLNDALDSPSHRSQRRPIAMGSLDTHKMYRTRTDNVVTMPIRLLVRVWRSFRQLDPSRQLCHPAWAAEKGLRQPWTGGCRLLKVWCGVPLQVALQCKEWSDCKKLVKRKGTGRAHARGWKISSAAERRANK